MIPRNEITERILARVVNATWGDPPRTWAYYSRRFQTWDDCPAQPAVYILQHDENPTQATRLVTRNVMEFQLVVYQNTAKDESVAGDVENSLIKDAIFDAFKPDPGRETQTLGGAVHHCWIEGQVFSDSGDLDGQGVITIPIRVLVP